MPAIPETMRPRAPARSSMARSSRETVAETAAQGSRRPARAPAPRRALPTVGSPPSRRSLAAWMSAALKKIVM